MNSVCHSNLRKAVTSAAATLESAGGVAHSRAGIDNRKTAQLVRPADVGANRARAVDDSNLFRHPGVRLSVETLVPSMLEQLSLIKGTLDILVLKTLSWGAMHGFEITTWLEERSGGTLDVEDSALYQALHRLEERGLIAAEWGMTENNRRARYYMLTRAGRTHLRAETSRWIRYSETVTDILGAATRSA